MAAFGIIERSVAALDVGGARAGSPDGFGYFVGLGADSCCVIAGAKSSDRRGRIVGDDVVGEKDGRSVCVATSADAASVVAEAVRMDLDNRRERHVVFWVAPSTATVAAEIVVGS